MSVKNNLIINGFVNKEIDMVALSEYLQYLYINAPKSIFKSIKKLPPGSTLLPGGLGTKLFVPFI